MGGTNNSNNSAFPIPALPARNMDPGASYSPDTGWIHAGSYGLTKREYYAGLAMQSYVMAGTLLMLVAVTASGKNPTPDKAEEIRVAQAEGAVAMADALLKALEGPQ